MSLNHKFIGEMVKRARTRKRMSQSTLAEKIDMSVAYISYIETAKRQASLDALARIANALGITTDYLMYGGYKNDPAKKQSEFDLLLEDCNIYERRMIYESAYNLKRSLRDNCVLLGC